MVMSEEACSLRCRGRRQRGRLPPTNFSRENRQTVGAHNILACPTAIYRVELACTIISSRVAISRNQTDSMNALSESITWTVVHMDERELLVARPQEALISSLLSAITIQSTIGSASDQLALVSA